MIVETEPICFRPEQTIKIDEGGAAFTLESREYKAPQCVVMKALAFDNRPQYISAAVAQSLTADGGGRGTQLIMSYQEITGTLNAGAHPGSYNGQDAYNDMFVVDDGDNNNKPQRLPHESGDEWRDGCFGGNGLQRPTDSDEIWGGW